MTRKRLTAQDRRVASKINEIHSDTKSWAEVSKRLGGVNRGTLSATARGKRRPTPQIVKALNLPKPIPKPRRIWQRACMDVLKIIHGEIVQLKGR